MREIVDKVFRNHVVDVEALCILNGELVSSPSGFIRFGICE